MVEDRVGLWLVATTFAHDPRLLCLAHGGANRGRLRMTDDTDAKARATAHGLIEGYIGPDHKVLDIADF
jgi:hypothetical protein